MINQNNLAKAVALTEGKKVQVNIAQIKEVMKIVLYELGMYTNAEIIALVDRVNKDRNF